MTTAGTYTPGTERVRDCFIVDCIRPGSNSVLNTVELAGAAFDRWRAQEAADLIQALCDGATELGLGDGVVTYLAAGAAEARRLAVAA